MKDRLTRRQVGRLAAGALGVAAAAGPVEGAGSSAEGSAPSTPSQQADQPAPPGPADPRITLIERGRSVPLTEAQRKLLVEAYKTAERDWAPAREFDVPDGTEPDFVFRPTPSAKGEPKEDAEKVRRDG
jgi:hypothetical protein